MSTRHAARSALSAALLPLLLLASPAARADSCDAIKAQIEARLRGNSLGNFTLAAVDAAASAPGRVVGNCAGGARKIVMTGGTPAAGNGSTAAPATAATPTVVNVATRQAAATAAAASKPADNILTECNDGSMSVGGSCRK